MVPLLDSVRLHAFLRCSEMLARAATAAMFALPRLDAIASSAVTGTGDIIMEEKKRTTNKKNKKKGTQATGEVSSFWS